ncbi:type 1 glutamine amidotransferase domain-containing protein [Aureisphaera galaxeae]|uniref:type 1 glutamine amidotransferase domain-containing protein n=1 Tax=Aureisphaera galaxeae TaxID=1538023 RepID=UPI0023507768|nr:type 1 glutamine amidotransferase domain-containing protein [Aureisphaera galaxeae]MDC8006383.1 type 1 glutamine amidotransferase domain-containing protein [Aureisphaera galaxeae]
MRISLVLLLLFLGLGCNPSTESQGNILFVVSNQHTYGDTTMNASNHFSEIVLAYDVFAKHGYTVDFVSPMGGAVPIGYIATSDSIQKRYLYDNNFMNLLKRTKSPSEINAEDYEVIYYCGGGAAMFGVPENENIQAIAKEIYDANGIISAICHGTAGIVNLKDDEGAPLYKNRKINGYPDLFENKEARYYQTFPFSIEEAIREKGGDFVYSEKRRDSFYIVDGRFMTGQDPSSSFVLATKIVEAIENKYSQQ